jgi:ornithine cyclodeaminase/alanine dehydrogenase-like protein (mu-crystallin family)
VKPALLLTRSDVAQLLDLDSCITAVEAAFRLHGEGGATTGVLAVHVPGGGFHIKAGTLRLSRPYFAAKTNANFPNNAVHGLPTIQGLILLADAEVGTPLALLDSMEITTLRTGAATAVAAKYLARPDARTVALIGCGNQGWVQLRSVCRVRRLTNARVYDRDRSRAEELARGLRTELGLEIEVSKDATSAARGSDIVVTCTSSHQPILTLGDVTPGAFVAAVGADFPEKQEIAPALLAASRVVVDVLDQAATFGDLHHAIAAGAMRREDVAAELGQIVAGRASVSPNGRDVIVFDSTGMALQDVAAAAAVYERAQASGRGTPVHLAG